MKINFVGDISLADSLNCQGYGVRTLMRRGHGDRLFDEVAPVLNGEGISYCNLETVLSTQGEDPNDLGSVDMRGEPAGIAVLNRLKLKLVNIANNHTMQHGAACFHETVELLKRNGAEVVGLKGSDGWRCEPVVFTSEGVRCGILGYSFQHDRFHTVDLPYACGDDAAIIGDIERLKGEVELVIVTCHWGYEFMDHPTADQIAAARSWVDAGAKLVVGHHPHVLQGMERYRGALIAYSLGNFMFDMLWCEEYRKTAILQVEYRDGAIHYSTVPAMLDMKNRLRLLQGEKAREFDELLSGLNDKVAREALLSDQRQGIKAYEVEYQGLINRCRVNSYWYFLKKFACYRKRFLLQQVKKTVQSHLEDFLGIFAARG
ncbi:CapA family protein [Citrifermentans bremense]|uniref:CapA family protein n=1 Tax=Citrifermentans bremense TaxID=60035 RepID=UPI00040B93B3|nr:CapA family protein [Citrifermentans bremense]